ncbi:MAG: glycoside hydrolase family 31 protein [Rubrobacteraceae bacterium]
MAEIFGTLPETGINYEPLGEAELTDHDDTSVRLRCGSTNVEVTALTPNLFRVGMFQQGRPADYDSPAMAKTDWEPAETAIQDSDGRITLSTPGGKAHVSLSPLRISFEDASGNMFAVDEPELGMGIVRLPQEDVFSAPLGNPVRLYKKREEGERYFACGQRTGGLEETGHTQLFWNQDPPMGHTADHDNLYTSTPFTLVMNHGRAWGLFLDNTHQVEFDLAKENADQARFEARGGDLIYYVFCGPEPRDVLQQYTELTGRTPMPPMWSLGHQQSRWSYMSEKEIWDLAKTFRKRDFPCDVIHFDIDYMDGFRVFTWNEETFPNPEKLLADLKGEGFYSVAIVDPGVKADVNYDIYTEGRKKDLYCKTNEGDEYHNVVWPGMCAFPDFTNPEAREWWGAKHEKLLDEGVAGIWCDMNEPALFVPEQSTMPDDVVHPGGGNAKLHAQVHNAYGSLMAQAVREGLLKLRPDQRPIVITRSGYAGRQRHAIQWTGDNSSWWEHLWMSMPQLMNMGLSGVAWAGVDIGGFFGDSNGELMARWYEFGVFQPFCRNHSAMDTLSQEPWAFGEPYESVARKMTKLRMRLLPYLYTLFEESHRTGAPIVRPLLFEYPGDTTTYNTDDEFLVGDAMLVAPITRPGIEHRHVYLPEGCWFHYWTGERFDGPAHILAHAPLGEPPIYVKANTAIPMGPEMNYTGEKPTDPLTLLLYPSPGSGESALYEDAGDGFAYLDGEYARRSISCEASEGHITIHISDRESSFTPERNEVRLEMRGLDAPEAVSLDGQESDWQHDAASRTLIVSLEEQETSSTIEVAL